MNINIHLPENMFERFLSALERIADATERIAGPVIAPDPPKPYPSTDWMTTTDAQTYQQEIEYALEAAGVGPTHWAAIEAAARSKLTQRPGNGSDAKQG